MLIYLLLALVIWPLTTHLFRDGAPFLLLVETPPTFGRSLRFIHIRHRNRSLILSSSCFAVCGHHLAPRIAIVFSLHSNLLSNSSMSHTSNFLISSYDTSGSSLHIHILLLCESYSIDVPHGHVCVATSSSGDGCWGGGGGG